MKLNGAHKENISYQDFKEKQYDLLADHVRKHLDMEQLYKIMRNNDWRTRWWRI